MTDDNDLPPINDLVPDDLSSLRTEADGTISVVNDMFGRLVCELPGCTNPVVGLAERCPACEKNSEAARKASPSPPRRTKYERVSPQEARETALRIAGSVSEKELGSYEAEIQRLREWAADPVVRIELPLAPDDIFSYIVDLLRRYGLPIPTSNVMPKVEYDDRVVEKTFTQALRYVDSWHRSQGVAAPWESWRNGPHGKRTWDRVVKAYLKEHAGMAADGLDLAVMYRLWVDLSNSTKMADLNRAALLAAVTDPLAEFLDGGRIPLSFFEDIAFGDIKLLSNGGVHLTNGTRTALLPAGNQSAVLTTRLYRARWETQTDRGPAAVPSRHYGPLYTPVSNRAGDAFARGGVTPAVVSSLLAAGADPAAWKAGRGLWVPPTIEDATLVLTNLLAIPDEVLRDLAWMTNALWVAARGDELLQRIRSEYDIGTDGVTWGMPRKPDKTGRRARWGAPHSPFVELDPVRNMEKWEARLDALWREQTDQEKAPEDAFVFPSNLKDVTTTSASAVNTFNRRLRVYKKNVSYISNELRFTTHSMRHTLVLNGRLMGIPDWALMHAGGWKDLAAFHGYYSGAEPLSPTSAAAMMTSKTDTPHKDAIAAFSARISHEAHARATRSCDCKRCRTDPLTSTVGS